MSTYFIVLVCAIVVPFLAGFDKRISFHKKWKFFFPAVGVSAGLFILWDIFFTKWGIWGFNPKHIQGLYIAELPIEEILFFIFIPYACVFSYEALKVITQNNWFEKNTSKISYALVLISLLNIILFYPKAYPLATFTLLLLLLCFNLFILKPRYLGHFYFTYSIMAIPFLMVNGVLTGTGIEEEVVWYNPDQIIGLRLATIPFEDYFYGMLLLLLTTNMYEGLKKKFEMPKN